MWITIENLGGNQKLMWGIYIRSIKLKNLLLEAERFRMARKEVPDQIITKQDIA